MKIFTRFQFTRVRVDGAVEVTSPSHRIVNKVCVPTHVAFRIFVMQVLASQLLFLASRNAGLAISPLFWPVNCIKIGGGACCAAE